MHETNNNVGEIEKKMDENNKIVGEIVKAKDKGYGTIFGMLQNQRFLSLVVTFCYS